MHGRRRNEPGCDLAPDLHRHRHMGSRTRRPGSRQASLAHRRPRARPARRLRKLRRACRRNRSPEPACGSRSCCHARGRRGTGDILAHGDERADAGAPGWTESHPRRQSVREEVGGPGRPAQPACVDCDSPETGLRGVGRLQRLRTTPPSSRSVPDPQTPASDRQGRCRGQRRESERRLMATINTTRPSGQRGSSTAGLASARLRAS